MRMIWRSGRSWGDVSVERSRKTWSASRAGRVGYKPSHVIFDPLHRCGACGDRGLFRVLGLVALGQVGAVGRTRNLVACDVRVSSCQGGCDRCRPWLCGIWRGLRNCGGGVVVACGRSSTGSLGPWRCCAMPSWHGRDILRTASRLIPSRTTEGNLGLRPAECRCCDGQWTLLCICTVPSGDQYGAESIHRLPLRSPIRLRGLSCFDATLTLSRIGSGNGGSPRNLFARTAQVRDSRFPPCRDHRAAYARPPESAAGARCRPSRVWLPRHGRSLS